MLLVAQDVLGVSVLRSRDGRWETAAYLGLVPVPAELSEEGWFVTAPIQVGSGLYMVLDIFSDPTVEGQTAGNRSSFPFVDITAQVEKLLRA